MQSTDKIRDALQAVIQQHDEATTAQTLRHVAWVEAGYSPHLGRCLKVEAMPPWLTSGSA